MLTAGKLFLWLVNKRKYTIKAAQKIGRFSEYFAGVFMFPQPEIFSSLGSESFLLRSRSCFLLWARSHSPSGAGDFSGYVETSRLKCVCVFCALQSPCSLFRTDSIIYRGLFFRSFPDTSSYPPHPQKIGRHSSCSRHSSDIQSHRRTGWQKTSEIRLPSPSP